MQFPGKTGETYDYCDDKYSKTESVKDNPYV